LNHCLVRIGTTLYDPSYGKTYSAPVANRVADFVSQAVTGYMLPYTMNEMVTNFDWNMDRVIQNIPVLVLLVRGTGGQPGLVGPA